MSLSFCIAQRHSYKKKAFHYVHYLFFQDVFTFFFSSVHKSCVFLLSRHTRTFLKGDLLYISYCLLQLCMLVSNMTKVSSNDVSKYK